MTRLDLTALPWNNSQVLCRAIADALEQWLTVLHGGAFPSAEHLEVRRLCTSLREITPRGKRRLETAAAHEIYRLEHRFHPTAKSNRFGIAHDAASVGISCWEGVTPEPSVLIHFQRLVDRTGRINVWDVFEPWRACDAFNILDPAQIHPEARAAFDAIWLATEYTAAYEYAAAWRVLQAVAA